jgi:probable phosphoglycerate mutase
MQGQHETDLTPLGERQATALGKRLEDVDFDLVFSSPQRRAMKTTQLILGKRSLPIIPDNALKEILMGDWQGILIEDLMEKYPEEIDLFWHHPEQYKREGCETYDEVRRRAGQFMERTAAENPGKTILVVTHGALLKTLYTYLSVTLVGVALLFWGASVPAMAYVSMALLGFGAGATYPVILNFIGGAYQSLSGTAMSIALGVALVGQYVFNMITGTVFDNGHYSFLPALLSGAVVCIMLLVPVAVRSSAKKQ